jgi:hypothetical protein
MLFEVVGEMNVTVSPEAEMAVVDHPIPPVATRQVWALSVQRPQNDPERATRPHKVIWLGDSTLRVPGDGPTCAYCNQFDLTRCPGMEEHAYHYGIRFSSKRPEVIEVGVFDVNAELAGRMEVIGQIEDILARRLTAGIHPAAG